MNNSGNQKGTKHSKGKVLFSTFAAIVMMISMLQLPVLAEEGALALPTGTPTAESVLCVHEQDAATCAECAALANENTNEEVPQLCEHGNVAQECAECAALANENTNEEVPQLCEHGNVAQECAECAALANEEVPQPCEHGNVAQECEECAALVNEQAPPPLPCVKTLTVR